MNRIHSFFLTLFCLLIGTAATARAQGTIHGYVTDASSGETLLMANIVIAGTAQGAATNTVGYYMLSGLEPGDYILAVSYIGYQTRRIDVTLRPGAHPRVDVALQPEYLVGDEVVVTGEREDEEERTRLGVNRMPAQLVMQLPAVFEADLFRSLQMLPGIKASSDFSSGLLIRGGSPDQTLILLDRTTVYNPSHFFGLFSTFNPDAIKDVQIYKGSYPARFGGRLGSVVDVYNKDGNREQAHGSVSLGLLASRASIEGPFEKGSWMLAARRSTLEPILAALRSGADGIPETFYFYDVNAKLNLDAGPKDRLSLATYAGLDKLRMSPVQDFSIDLPYGNRTGSLIWTHLFSHRLFATYALTGSHYFSNPDLSLGGSPFSRRNEVTEAGFKADMEYAPGERHQIEAGLWAGQIMLSLHDRGEGEGAFDLKRRTPYVAAYLQDVWRPAAAWSIKTGLRVQRYASDDALRPEPRLSVEGYLSPDLRVQAAYGRYYQYLTLASFYSMTAMDIWLGAGKGVPPAWGDQFGLGIKTVPAKGYRLDIETYARTMNDLFELDPNLQDPIGLPYARYFRYGEGLAYGAEVMLEKTDGALTGFAAYTYSRSTRRFPGVNGGASFPSRYERIHDVNLVLNYDLSRRWRTTLSFVYAAGQPYTRALGRIQYDDPFNSVPIDQIVVGRVNASRLPGYHRLDVGFTRRGRFFGVAESEFQIQVINLYNHRNIWFYDYDFQQNPVALDPVRMLPLLPNASLTVRF
ncbi:MAG: TonB-dependent receptor [Rhodothermales bacterium]